MRYQKDFYLKAKAKAFSFYSIGFEEMKKEHRAFSLHSYSAVLLTPAE